MVRNVLIFKQKNEDVKFSDSFSYKNAYIGHNNNLRYGDFYVTAILGSNFPRCQIQQHL